MPPLAASRPLRAVLKGTNPLKKLNTRLRTVPQGTKWVFTDGC